MPLMRWLVAVLLLVSCGSDGQELKGSITAPECGGGYAITNANVTLRDGGNNVIGTTTTSDDVPTEGPGNVASDDDACHAEFTIADVPEADFYQITVGTHDGPSYSLAEIEAQSWTMELSLE